jgi:hypothetical protein
MVTETSGFGSRPANVCSVTLLANLLSGLTVSDVARGRFKHGDFV